MKARLQEESLRKQEESVKKQEGIGNDDSGGGGETKNNDREDQNNGISAWRRTAGFHQRQDQNYSSGKFLIYFIIDRENIFRLKNRKIGVYDYIF
jgi:hypothetical protein